MGNIFNAVGDLMQGRQQANQLRDQGELEGRSAEIARANAEITARQYSAREEMVRRSARRALGAQRAAMAESGTGFDGSNLSLMRESTASAELDALNVRYAGALERAGLLNTAAVHDYNKTALRKAAKATMRMRWFNAASSFFGGRGVNTTATTATPTLSGGAYGQGSMGQFGNNVGSFTATGSSGGYTGYGLSGGYGSIGGYNSIMGGG